MDDVHSPLDHIQLQEFLLFMRINEMKIKNLFFAIYDQLTRKGAWRNIFVTHNAFGIFSRYSHTARGSGKQKDVLPYESCCFEGCQGNEREAWCAFLRL